MKIISRKLGRESGTRPPYGARSPTTIIASVSIIFTLFIRGTMLYNVKG